MTRPIVDAREYPCAACGDPGGIYGDRRCWPCWLAHAGLSSAPARRPVKRSGSSPEAKRNAIAMLSEALGLPLPNPATGEMRWPCPVCTGGMDDRSDLPYRPLVLAADGRMWCDAMWPSRHGLAVCEITPERLRTALDRLRGAAA